jgi:hypothetical protein
MSGKAETANVPPGSRRACRGVLTQDFDDLQGNMQTMYTAVIFNPVPGPPMGKNPRLSFRYWLKGTETLRVQIYSLTNGYHRFLSLTGLPQETWGTAAVDMTEVRRPDGSGGPLSENERIDDVQFYADPRAELIVDDLVLYDAAVADEKRPFPKNFGFTGWFDTGKQARNGRAFSRSSTRPAASGRRPVQSTSQTAAPPGYDCTCAVSGHWSEQHNSSSATSFRAPTLCASCSSTAPRVTPRQSSLRT